MELNRYSGLSEWSLASELFKMKGLDLTPNLCFKRKTTYSKLFQLNGHFILVSKVCSSHVLQRLLLA